MWLIFALITFLLWGGADLFYKKAAEGRFSHLKTGMVVGLVMGSSAGVTLLTTGMSYDLRNLVIYLPVSLMYILSMVIGYFGLRYLEVSISSPIQNASGAVSSLLMMIVLRRLPDGWSLLAMLLVTAGVVLLGIWERRENLSGASGGEKRFRVGAAAVLIPVLYCVIDSLGTFFDGWYLDDVSTTPLLGVSEDTLEDVANVSYQLTFLMAAVLIFIYVYLIRGERITLRGNGNRLLAALLETGGQFTYVRALSGNGILAAPVIGSYCVASILLGRVFLKEKLELRKYAAIGLVVTGVVIFGILEGLGA